MQEIIIDEQTRIENEVYQDNILLNIDINAIENNLLKPYKKFDTTPISYPANSPANALIPLTPGDRNLVSLPLFHIGGLAIIFRCLHAGASLVFGCNQNGSEDLIKFKITHTSMVATQLHRLLKQDIKHLSLKHALIGGGPVDT